MSVLSGFLTGTLAIAALEALASNPNAAGQIGAFGSFATVVIDRVVSPDVPAIGRADFVPPPPFTAPDTPDQPATPATPQPVPSPQLRSTKSKPPHPIPRPT